MILQRFDAGIREFNSLLSPSKIDGPSRGTSEERALGGHPEVFNGLVSFAEAPSCHQAGTRKPISQQTASKGQPNRIAQQFRQAFSPGAERMSEKRGGLAIIQHRIIRSLHAGAEIISGYAFHFRHRRKQTRAPGETLALMEVVGLRNIRLQRLRYASRASFFVVE